MKKILNIIVKILCLTCIIFIVYELFISDAFIKPDIDTNITTLLNDYNNDYTTANEKYKNKKMIFRGNIEKINYDKNHKVSSLLLVEDSYNKDVNNKYTVKVENKSSFSLYNLFSSIENYPVGSNIQFYGDCLGCENNTIMFTFKELIE